MVPCKEGQLRVRELTQQALQRYLKTREKDPAYWVKIHHLEYTDGGILDPDDVLADVVEDKDKSEVTLLRNEVAQLKQLLLAHKDCPVTAMQKKSGYHTADKDDSSEDLSVPSSPHTEAIQHSSVSTSNGVSSTSKAEAVATSVLTQMADQSTEPVLSQIVMAPSSQSQPSGS